MDFHAVSNYFFDPLSLSMRHSNVVVNLIGKQYQTYNFKFGDVNVDGARRIARIAREEGVDRLVHISSMNAKEKPDVRLAQCLDWTRCQLN